MGAADNRRPDVQEDPDHKRSKQGPKGSDMDQGVSNKRAIDPPTSPTNMSKDRRKDRDTLVRDVGESRGALVNDMAIDNIDQDRWENLKEDRRETRREAKVLPHSTCII